MNTLLRRISVNQNIAGIVHLLYQFPWLFSRKSPYLSKEYEPASLRENALLSDPNPAIINKISTSG